MGDVRIGGDEVIVMAGPCSAETDSQVRAAAAAVRKAGAKIFRGGAFKPRSSPYSFQGLGEEGLRMLRDAAKAENLQLVTEVMDANQIEVIGRYADIYQVGARNMQNFTLLRELGYVRKPVMNSRRKLPPDSTLNDDHCGLLAPGAPASRRYARLARRWECLPQALPHIHRPVARNAGRRPACRARAPACAAADGRSR